ncbi:MAG TPA: hypothetical protein VIC28_11225 [Thermoanaerobaculia bacterium]|jgi:hypothetical protein
MLSRRMFSCAALGLLAALPAHSATWQSLGFPGRGVPNFLFVDNGISLVVDEGFLTTPQCCPSVVHVHRGDHDGSSASTLETLGPTARLFGAAQFSGGVAALVNDNGTFVIKHYSFSGVITTITPGVPAGTAGPLASDGQTLYAVWDNNLLSLSSLSGSWASGPALPVSLPAGRRQHGVVRGAQVYWQMTTSLLRFTPPSTFDTIPFPAGYQIRDLSAWTEAGGVIYVVVTSPANTAAMLEFSPIDTVMAYDSTFAFQDYSGAWVLGSDVLVGAFDRSGDHFGVLLAFDTGAKTWSEFSPQGPWFQVFGQITNVAVDGGVPYVAWERLSFETVSRLQQEPPPPPPPFALDAPILSPGGLLALAALLAGLALRRIGRGRLSG